MAVKSYVLIETEVGTAKSVADHLKDIHYRDASVTQVDTVTGRSTSWRRSRPRT